MTHNTASDYSAPTLLRVLWPGIRSQYFRLILGFTYLVASVVLSILEPWPLQYVIDYLLVPNVNHPLAADARTSNLNVLTWCTIALVAIAAGRAAAEYHQAVLFSILGNHAIADLRSKVYRHLQSLSLGFHGRSRSGDLTLRLVSDMNMLKEVAVSAALPLASNTLVWLGCSDT